MFQETPHPSVFLSVPWVSTWMSVFGGELEPEGHLWRDPQGEVVACVILSIRRERVGPFRVCRAHLNATGEARVGSEHNDVLSRPSARPAVLASLTEGLLERGVDEFALTGFRMETVDEFRELWPSPTYHGHFSEDPFVALDELRGAGSDYLGALSRNSRSAIRRSMRLYEERYGPPSFEIATTTETALDWFSELERLHEARWESRGESGAFAPKETQLFHRRFLSRCTGLSAGSKVRVDLARVRFGDMTIGVLYNLRHRGRVCFYQSGIRYDDDNRLKPGLVMHTLAVENYLATGEREYDFLGGEPSAVQYKRSLSTRSRTLAWIQLGAPTWRTRLIAPLRKLKRRLRQR